MTRKPYYKLVIGKKPYTSTDLRFDCGRVRVELSDALRDRFKLADVFDTRWTPLLTKVLAFWNEHGADPCGVTLTEPADRPLAAEVAALKARQAEAQARRAARMGSP